MLRVTVGLLLTLVLLTGVALADAAPARSDGGGEVSPQVVWMET
ncbi:MAG: hypothetical protein ACOY93_14370 [Bacillota bacterium]